MALMALGALLPVFVILFYVYVKDTRKEPFSVLITTFMLGALAVVPAILAELGGSFISENPFFENFLIVSPAEEGVKLFVIMIYVFSHREFDDRFDAIIYCVTASLGFAAVENLIYTFENGIEVAILRAVTAIPGHTAFAVFMGSFVAKAKTHAIYNRKEKRNKYILLAFLVPAIMHGLYDFLISIKFFWGFAALIIYSDIHSIIIVNKASKEDRPFQQE